MKAKIIYLMGGLGNVLFQLNYFYNLRMQGVDVKADCTLLKNGNIAKIILGWSDHQTLDLLSDLELSDDIDLKSDGYKYILAGALAKFIGRDILSARYCGHAAPVISNLTANHLFGYFHQDSPINKVFVEKIRYGISRRLTSSEFSYVRDALETIGDNFVVHVRGGDYEHDSAFAISSDYYRKALSGQQKCYIVTNDRGFSRSLFKDIGIAYEFLESKTPLEDFIILVLCVNKILANSTFSWWAAELGNSDGRILQPDPFFNHIVDWRPDSRMPRQLVSVL
jgi:hypothetical protein